MDSQRGNRYQPNFVVFPNGCPNAENRKSPENNSWDEVWMRVKFTGPAYVPGSSQQNAIVIDQVVFVRSSAPQEGK